MLKNKIYILVCSSIVLSVYLSAAPLDKYYIPPQATGYTTTQPDIETEFRNKVSRLSPEEREKIKQAYQQKMDTAAKNKDYKAAAYYQRLIDILNSF